MIHVVIGIAFNIIALVFLFFGIRGKRKRKFAYQKELAKYEQDKIDIDKAYQRELAKYEQDKIDIDKAYQEELAKYEKDKIDARNDRERRFKIELEKYNNTIVSEWNKDQESIREMVDKIQSNYESGDHAGVEEYCKSVLSQSFYPIVFGKDNKFEYIENSKVLLVEYRLPNLQEIPNIKDIKYFSSLYTYRRICLTDGQTKKLYDDIIYAITLRSIAELFHYDFQNFIDVINFNGRVSAINPATGKIEDNCILSVQVRKKDFEQIDLLNVDPKACFRLFKGVCSAKLSTITPIVPIVEINKKDKRFVDSHDVFVNDYTNLASMDWEEFEHLIRGLFDKEFNYNGGEVKITQASRDGGVDAIAFDPDPIRGGKIVIQAKRYTNTVGVSAVRDLYGTVINEGANKGILITTSDYGADSYNFVKDKPLTLLNGGHLLYLLEKHGRKARIDIEQAKQEHKQNQNLH